MSSTFSGSSKSRISTSPLSVPLTMTLEPGNLARMYCGAPPRLPQSELPVAVSKQLQFLPRSRCQPSSVLGPSHTANGDPMLEIQTWRSSSTLLIQPVPRQSPQINLPASRLELVQLSPHGANISLFETRLCNAKRQRVRREPVCPRLLRASNCKERRHSGRRE